MGTATVYAANGTTVNMRVKPNMSANLIARIDIGTKVEILEDNGEWCKISCNGRDGYMMAKFLKTEDDNKQEMISVPKEEALKAYNILENCTRQLIVNKADVENVYDLIGNWLNLRG